MKVLLRVRDLWRRSSARASSAKDDAAVERASIEVEEKERARGRDPSLPTARSNDSTYINPF